MFQAIILCNIQEDYWSKLEKVRKKLILDQILGHLASQFFGQFYLY